MKISFIGLGTMGAGMAMNLGTKAQGKFRVVAIARRQEVLAPFAAAGISTSLNNQDAAQGDITFLCLPTIQEVTEVLFGEKGIAPLLKPGHIVVDCSTISYNDAREVHAKLAKQGVRFLDAPISGHHNKAVAGTLTIMVGGDEELFNEVKPYLDLMGTNVVYVGAVGGGQVAKTINNCVFDICIAAFCELMPLGIKKGLKPEALAQVLMTGSGSSYATKTLLPEVLEGKFDHGFTLNRAYKDIIYMQEIAGQEGLEVPTFNGMVKTYTQAILDGYGEEYKGAMIKVYEKLLDVECRQEK